ncbi:bile acid:sodium symporter family protein [Prauserella cavernicola]|uniref:Bile acid:sodium symporter family protein n=1 Tax=Prauserella cavernicola TaxID=2800127 RepID=A0A934QYG2_9PSEU|nr:bile acid:sodium symporter family protein [Prauserella cavernicola]MBK1787834.1 bile acid:sodium symporter family protein [Prauserella cavernicola]
MRKLRLACLGLAALGALVLVVGLVVGAPSVWQPALVVTGFGIAIGLGALPALSGYQYTGWVIACVAAALVYPGGFESWGGVELTDKFLINTIIQLVMFGMAIHMRINDFKGVARQPRGVLVGLFGHYLIMPTTAVILVQIFELPPEVALGVILYGCVSSGLASNVMSLLAKANLGLAVTITAMSTILSPLATPALMQLFGGTIVEVGFVSTMFDVIKITVVPVGAALLVDYLRTASPRATRVVNIAAGVSAVWLVVGLSLWNTVTAGLSANAVLALQQACYVAAAIILARAYYAVETHYAWIGRAMPYVSMFGIMYYNTVVTAAARDTVLTVGGVLLLIGLIHNLTGFSFGYWAARAARLDIPASRSVSFEIGMQNGGAASGLAASMGMIATAGVPAAVFSPLGNVTGSLLANYWSRRPVSADTQDSAPDSGAELAIEEKR